MFLGLPWQWKPWVVKEPNLSSIVALSLLFTTADVGDTASHDEISIIGTLCFQCSLWEIIWLIKKHTYENVFVKQTTILWHSAAAPFVQHQMDHMQ